ncbi:MAG: FtsW/RodA/SpoVE family cell cycle protein [Clostridia bacterium]|nr:FtsW/RodA/SpoVE family cell cycle protein [Clostridia bacterium]
MAQEQTAKTGNPFSQFFKDCVHRFVIPEAKQIYQGPLTVVKQLKNPADVFSRGISDVTYIITVLALVLFGLLIHYSASYSNMEQLVYAIAGLVVMAIASHVKIETYKNVSAAFMMLATAFMFIVLLTSEDYNGTHRWLWHFQPSELGKVALILYLAYLIDKYKEKHLKLSTFVIFLIITAFYGVLVLAESHLSGAILFLCIGYSMMWFGDMSKKGFAVITAIVVIGILAVIWKPDSLSLVPGIHEYQIDRIRIWKKILLDENSITAKEKINNARQVLQSLYGIGSGGFFGVGFGNSGQKVSNLSEKSNDFIFAVIGEELGFFGSIGVIALFGFLVFQGIRIAIHSKTYYGSLVALGISVQIALQVLINIAVATSLLPNTGISLPFFSSGGSSMLISLASVGIVLSVAKDTDRSKGVKQNAKR